MCSCFRKASSCTAKSTSRMAKWTKNFFFSKMLVRLLMQLFIYLSELQNTPSTTHWSNPAMVICIKYMPATTKKGTYTSFQHTSINCNYLYRLLLRQSITVNTTITIFTSSTCKQLLPLLLLLWLAPVLLLFGVKHLRVI